MARKNDILSIYTKEVEGIKEAGLFKGEAPFDKYDRAHTRDSYTKIASISSQRNF